MATGSIGRQTRLSSGLPTCHRPTAVTCMNGALPLTKIERGHAKDLLDVTEMLRRKLATPEELLAHTEAIRPQIRRYPAVDEESFVRRVKEFLGERHDV